VYAGPALGGGKEEKEECEIESGESPMMKKKKKNSSSHFQNRLPFSFFSLLSFSFFSSSSTTITPLVMDSGASFSEPKISMEPLKAVQVSAKRREEEERRNNDAPSPLSIADSVFARPLLRALEHVTSCSLSFNRMRASLFRRGG